MFHFGVAKRYQRKQNITDKQKTNIRRLETSFSHNSKTEVSLKSFEILGDVLHFLTDSAKRKQKPI